MTKARGAADSIGKAGRGASFLLPAFSPYYVPYFPLFLRARAPIRIYIHIRGQTHIHTHMTDTHSHIPAFSFLSVLPLASVDLLSYPPSPSHPPCRSPSASPHRSAPPSFSSLLLYIRVYAYVCTCASSQSSYARFHVARLYAPAARGRLCTWVNGKMSFETFLGRSRSPHCQSYTREIPLSRKRSPPPRVVSLDDGAGGITLNFANEDAKRTKVYRPLRSKRSQC